MQKLYIIRGTGLNLDGQVVEIVEDRGDYSVVSPPNSNLEIQGTMVHKKCLQEIDNLKEKITYVVTINKYYGVFPNTIPNKNFGRNIVITNALRDVNVETITEYLETNLSPILRMD